MKKILPIIILMCSFSAIFSQNVKIEKKIEWETGKNDKNSNGLQFKEAVYSGNLPLYVDCINLSELKISSTNVDLKIVPLETENISLSEDENIADNLSLQYSVYYGREQLYVNFEFIPIVKTGGLIQKINRFEVVVTQKKSEKITKERDYAENSVLSSGKWVKIGIPTRGVYKIPHQKLKDLGFSNPSAVRVFGNDVGEASYKNNGYHPDDLVENTIYKGSDYIMFFAEAAQKWTFSNNSNMFEITKNIYCDTAYYFLSDVNTGFDNNVKTVATPTEATSATISNYIYRTYFEENLENLIHSGRFWLGEDFDYAKEKTKTFEIPDYVAGATGKVAISVAVRSGIPSYFKYGINGTNYTEKFKKCGNATHEFYADSLISYYDFTQNSSNINIKLSYDRPTNSSNAWLDKIIINGVRKLNFSDQLDFRSLENIGENNYSEFKLSAVNSQVIIWDVSNPTRPKKINFNLSGSVGTFKTKTDKIKEFVAFSTAGGLEPVYEGQTLGEISNQNLHNFSPKTDMLIVTPPIFKAQAEQFAQHHRNTDNMIVIVATTEQIYNEFGSGMSGVVPIKNYVRMLYEKTNKHFNFVLLFGDGSYNNFGATEQFNPNYIPTYQTRQSLNDAGASTTTDDFFALLDDNESEYFGKLDIAVGRLPVKTIDEAQAMVNKLHAYFSKKSYGDWRNIVTLVADDNDENESFTDNSEILANSIRQKSPFINIKKVYLDSYVQKISSNGEEYPDAVIDFNNRVNNGSLIVNYFGHGSEEALSGERLVTRKTIKDWKNMNGLSLFITSTCKFSRFDNSAIGKDKTSAGETVILNPHGGAIIMITTTRVSYTTPSFNLNKKLYNYLLVQKNGKGYTVGEAYYLAKNADGNQYSCLFFILLGDPAIRLQYPENKVHTSEINNIPIASFTDTVKALEKISIGGYITDKNDNLLTDFSGNLMLSLFDKKQNLQTLNNDGNGVRDYWSQYNKLFRGRASVKNGKFEIKLIVPKDIIYSYGKPKLSYYASGNNVQATGYFYDFILGGLNKDAPEDKTGPQIRLFMNDSNFVSGSITDENPIIYSILSDESGINTSSASIGHDITAILDESVNTTYSLNEYYQADVDNYKKGSVSYNLFKIKPGRHTVSLTVWDTYNNSSKKSIEFVVAQNDELRIEHLLNYPNPFTTNTDFYFEHNKPDVMLDVLLQIFTVSGKLVKTIHQPMLTSGFRSEPINWNGLDDFGNRIGSGVYIYRLKIRSQDGKKAEKYEKILILK